MAAMPPDADSFRTLRRAMRAMISSRHLFVCWNYVVRWNYASSVAKAAFAAAGGETATRAEVSFANYASRTTPLPQGVLSLGDNAGRDYAYSGQTAAPRKMAGAASGHQLAYEQADQ